jgi:plasmid stability protein
MPKMLQVRNVPDRLHRELTRRAKGRGQTLSDYVRGILEREVARPPASEVFARIERRSPVKLSVPAAELIREEREEQDAT